MHIKTSDQKKVKMGFGEYECNWGLHIAGLYETDEERDAIIFGFFDKGLKLQQQNLYVPVEQTQSEFKKNFAKCCPHHSDKLEDEDKLALKDAKELYYPEGTFSPWDMDQGLTDYFEHTQRNGKRYVRTAAEMVWALEKIPGREHLMAYESRLNYFCPGKPWISFCMYNITKFSGDIIMHVLKTHPYTVNGGIITQNPYYMDPDEYLKEHAPEFLPQNKKN